MGNSQRRADISGGRFMNVMQNLPVTVVGGYLGAGKTTLVNYLLRNANGLRLAVLVNEFGELAIDKDLIEAEDDGLISISGGCVCCSFGGDLIAALRGLSQMKPQPQHILIEFLRRGKTKFYF